MKCDSIERKCLIIRWVCQTDSDNNNHRIRKISRREKKRRKRKECVGKGNLKINKIMNKRENI